MYEFLSDPALTPASPEDACIQRAERHLRMLAELAEIGMDLARALKRRVEAETDAEADEPPPVAGRDPADGFQRISRAVRLTVALETKLGEALRALIAGELVAAETRKAETARRDGEAREQRHKATKNRVSDLVNHVMAAGIEDQEEYEACYEALEERLEEDEAYEGYADKPLRETVERLCADLGLTPDWSLWTDDGCDGSWAFPPSAVRPAHSIFNQPRRTPFWRERVTGKPPRLE